MKLASALTLAALVACPACEKQHKTELIPDTLLEDETLSPQERAAKKAEAEAAKPAEQPEAPPAPEVKAPDDVDAPPADAKQSAKGVYYVVLKAGTGARKPTAKNRVKVHYSGWTTDGQLFDSSVRRGEPAVFPVGALIPGWVEILQMMVAGDKWRIWIPEELAYQGRADAPQGMLVFDMELIEIVD